MARPARRITSRDFEIREGVFDMDLKKLPVEERESAREVLFPHTIPKRTFEHKPNMTDLQSLPKI